MRGESNADVCCAHGRTDKSRQTVEMGRLQSIKTGYLFHPSHSFSMTDGKYGFHKMKQSNLI